MPILPMALSMGYLRYRERGGIKYFCLTNAGYDAIGAERLLALWSVISLVQVFVRLT